MGLLDSIFSIENAYCKQAIKSLVNKYGTSNWTFISNQMGQNRSGKQCRERWYNQLNPNMKKNNLEKQLKRQNNDRLKIPYVILFFCCFLGE